MKRLHIGRMRKFVETIGFVIVLIGGTAIDAPSMVPAVVCMGIGAVLIAAANVKNNRPLHRGK